jgi:hypothetical protein
MLHRTACAAFSSMKKFSRTGGLQYVPQLAQYPLPITFVLPHSEQPLKGGSVIGGIARDGALSSLGISVPQM